MKRILVTGGAGFLGSHLCEALLKRGHYVIALDNFFTGKKENILDLFQFPHFEFIEEDICKPQNLVVDEIYNLACPASPIHYQYDPVQTTRTSVMGALNMLELAKKNGAKIFQASTSEIYGDPNIHPQPETYFGNVNPIGPRACYDEGKRCAETLFFDYYRQFKIKIKVGRIFNTYGPKMHPNDGRVVSNFIVQAINNQPLTIYGEGQQTRSFCFVSDLIEGIILLMESDENLTGPINLGNPQEFSMLKLGNQIIKLTGSSSTLLFQPLPKDDPKQRKPDISLARNHLNWMPTIALEEGLKKTIAYFKNVL